MKSNTLNPGTTYFDVLESLPTTGWHNVRKLVEEVPPEAYGMDEPDKQRLQTFLTDLVERGAVTRQKPVHELTEYHMSDVGREAIKA